MIASEISTKLIEAAVAAYHKAYAPYSRYSVGAAVLTDSGEIFDGVNVENAVYPLTICAERVAIFKAVSQGQRSFQAIAVVTKNGGTPCGSCRQVMAEFGPEAVVLIADTSGQCLNTFTVKELLPSAFGKADLEAN